MESGSPFNIRANRAYSVDTGTPQSIYQTASQQRNWQDPTGVHQVPQPITPTLDPGPSVAEPHLAPQSKAVAFDPGLEVGDQSRAQSTPVYDSDAQQRRFLQAYDCEYRDLTAFDTESRLATSKQTGSKVVIKRTHRSALQAAYDVEREIDVITTALDPSIPLLIESLELRTVIWTVKEYRPLLTVAQAVQQYGPVPDERLKTALNQLFSGIASLFHAGFAHLRICDKTVCFTDDDMPMQLKITEFQFACKYGEDKVDELYAPTQEKYGDDIYVAPEVFACHTYNARKAVMWSCGVLLYFMVTGDTGKLSNLAHPSFDNTVNPAVEPAAPSPRRSSAANHARKLSVAEAKSRIILYPHNRFDIPNYARWIIPKMLVQDPTHRAELIEIASRVPKEFTEKATRPLMELAWLDYKQHVGPLAGLLDLGEQESLLSSSASSIYSMASQMSNPFKSLMGRGHSRRKSAPVNVGTRGW